MADRDQPDNQDREPFPDLPPETDSSVARVPAEARISITPHLPGKLTS